MLLIGRTLSFSPPCYPLPVFFFQAEDGIRDATVTGVQTCALPIFVKTNFLPGRTFVDDDDLVAQSAAWCAQKNGEVSQAHRRIQIGRASCRERVEMSGGARSYQRPGGRALDAGPAQP